MTKPSTYIIAEAGVNHNGCLDRAKQLVNAAVQAGADAVKFQSFVPELLVTQDTPQAEYQQRNLGTKSETKSPSQLSMLQQLALTEDEHGELLLYCVEKNIDYLSSPFDQKSLYYLCEVINVPQIKFGSGEITNAPLLLDAASNQKRVILSTGMSTLDEIESSLGVLAFGYTRDQTQIPSVENFTLAFASENGQQALKHNVTLLHCTSDYPCPYPDVNLLAMDTLAHKFALRVGFSDHTSGIEVAIAAVARGAEIIEKHFTLDRDLPGPDHKASLEPNELAQMVRSIRNVELSLGSANKSPTEAECKTKSVVRKHLVAATKIKAGEPFTTANVIAKRTANGLPPIKYWEVLSHCAKRDYEIDEVIQL